MSKSTIFAHINLYDMKNLFIATILAATSIGFTSCNNDDEIPFVRATEENAIDVESFFSDKAYTNTKNSLLISLTNLEQVESIVKLSGDATFYNSKGEEVNEIKINKSEGLSFVPNTSGITKISVSVSNSITKKDTVLTLSSEEQVDKTILFRYANTRIVERLTKGENYNRFWYAGESNILFSTPLQESVTLLPIKGEMRIEKVEKDLTLVDLTGQTISIGKSAKSVLDAFNTTFKDGTRVTDKEIQLSNPSILKPEGSKFEYKFVK